MSGDSGSATALVVVDVLNPYQHDDADRRAGVAISGQLLFLPPLRPAAAFCAFVPP